MEGEKTSGEQATTHTWGVVEDWTEVNGEEGMNSDSRRNTRERTRESKGKRDSVGGGTDTEASVPK